jgi:hypothetical protein
LPDDDDPALDVPRGQPAVAPSAAKTGLQSFPE